MIKNRNNSSRATPKVWRFITKPIILAVIIFLALFFIISYIWKSFRASDYFKVTEVITKGTDSIDLSYLKGKNIFSIGLERESRYILESFPEYANVKLARIFPGRVFVDFIKRLPVAFVKLYKYFAVDENGVIFYPESQPEEPDLPVIGGLETKIFGPKPGKKYNIRELSLALGIIKEAQRNSALKIYKIKKIDLVSFANASVLIQDADQDLLEVKLGAENIKYKLAMLGGLLNAAKKDIRDIKYIDLRFKEPVIKFNDAKSK